MSDQATSRILRTPPGTHGSLSGMANPHAKPIEPWQMAVSSLTFVAALFTLGYFAITNWSNGVETYRSVTAPAPLSEDELTARDLDEKVAIAASTSTLDTFYEGELSDAGNPFASHYGPQRSEDGTGYAPVMNAYGTPTLQLFAAESGGWAVPYTPLQPGAQSGLQ